MSIQYNGIFYGCKNEKFQMKKNVIFLLFLLETEIVGTNGYPQIMFYSRNKKNNVYPCKPHFFYIKSGVWGVKITWTCFRDDKTYNKTDVTSKVSDQPVHLPSMVRVLFIPLWIAKRQ